MRRGGDSAGVRMAKAEWKPRRLDELCFLGLNNSRSFAWIRGFNIPSGNRSISNRTLDCERFTIFGFTETSVSILRSGSS